MAEGTFDFSNAVFSAANLIDPSGTVADAAEVVQLLLEEGEIDIDSAFDIVDTYDASDSKVSRNVLNETTPVNDYVNSQSAAYSTLVATETTLLDNHGSGNKVNRTTARETNEAKSFRYTAGTVFDVYSPFITFNSINTAFQSKSTNTQTFHNQFSSVYNWTRSQNSNVLETSNNYRYATNRDYLATTNHFHQSSWNHSYSDSQRLQVGQERHENVSQNSVVNDDTYGNLYTGVWENAILNTKKGVMSASAATGIVVNSESAISMRAKEGVSIRSDHALDMRAYDEMTIGSSGTLKMSSASTMVLNSGAFMHMHSSMIYAGTSGAIRPSVSLDASSKEYGALSESYLDPSFDISTLGSVAGLVTGGGIKAPVMSLASSAPRSLIPTRVERAVWSRAGIDSQFKPSLGALLRSASFTSRTGAFNNYKKLQSKLPVLKDKLTEIARRAVLYLTRFLAFLQDPVQNFLYREYPNIKNIQGYRSSGTPGPSSMLSTAFTAEIGSPTLPLQYEQETSGTGSEETSGTASQDAASEDVDFRLE